jgi:hypothetical protein
MTNFKKNRIVDLKLLSRIRKQICLVYSCAEPKDRCVLPTCSDAHHVKSVGSGGHDLETNVIPLCRKHHTEIHAIGLNRFSEKYAKVSVWLSRNGWSYNSNCNRWTRDD